MNRKKALAPADSVSKLSGIGPARTVQLGSGGVHTVGDLLFHLPTRWEDRRNLSAVAVLSESDKAVLLRGRVKGLTRRRTRRRGFSISEGNFEDDTGTIGVIWFNARWFDRRLQEDTEVYLFGSVNLSPKGNLQIVNPEVEVMGRGEREGERFVPVYPSLGPLSGRMLRTIVGAALPATEVLEDPLPEDLRREWGLPELGSALRSIHEPPPDMGDSHFVALERRRSPAHIRLAFDELLAFSIGLAEIREARVRGVGPRCLVDNAMRRRVSAMAPFELTGAQRRVLREISGDLQSGPPMARLVQGDVGCGKTVVAAMAMLIALENSHQTALMAPTELLAGQHFTKLKELFSATPWSPKLLTGSLRAAERRDTVAGLAEGRYPFIVGTHALIQEALEFSNLGLAVVDEQHRFGTAQREALVAKGAHPHLLVMTATPIPRSLALTLYGDLDLSVIDELPPGRTPVRTEIRTDSARSKVYEFLRSEIDAGGRVYVVFPLIEESEALDARALEQNVEELRSALGDAEVGVLHGRLAGDEREAVYRDFRSGVVKVLAATTVVEVGVDVPEASVMVIESAERFGLSQLHQLRGRVGRGSRKSWCVLMVGDDISEKARFRLDLFARTSDGFEIADADLKVRGPGDLIGTRQWGPSHFRFADLLKHHDLAVRARIVSRQLAASGRLGAVRKNLARYHRTEFGLPVG
ncbi:MAG: ATP-dependent DNA helicase RecG [Thermoanaerobaculales bacterium]|nr:ATP-dependent DNA helicase RecG [Thermoanaerobaculales bacterium]